MPPTNESNDNIESLFTRDASGRFQSHKKQVEQLRKALVTAKEQEAKFQKQIEKATKDATKGLKQQNHFLRQKEKIQNQLRRSQNDVIRQTKRASREQEKRLNKEHKLMRRNVRLENRVSRLREKQARMARRRAGASGAGIGIGGILGGLGIAGLSFTAIRQLERINQARVNTFLNLGRGAVGRIGSRGGVSSTSRAGLLSSFQGSGLNEFILGQSKQVQNALLSAQQQLQGTIGAQLGGELLVEFTKTLEPLQRKQFLQAIKTKGLSGAVSGFTNQFNFAQATRLQNATQAPIDPLLKQRIEFNKVTEKLTQTFERLVVTVGSDLIPVVEKLVPKIVGLLEWLSKLTSGQLLAGGGALAAAGLAGRGLLAGGKLGAKGIGLAGRGLAGLAGTAAGSAGLIAAPVAIGGGVLIHGSEQASKGLRNALQAQERASSRARALKGIDRQIAQIQPAGVESNWLLGPQPTGELTSQQKRQLARLNEQRAAILKRTRAEQQATKATQERAKQEQKATQDTTDSLITRLQDLQAPRELAGVISGRRKAELQLAQQGLFGPRLARNELMTLRESLQEELAKTNDLLDTQVEILKQPNAPVEAKKEAERLRAEVIGLRSEIKQTNIQLQQQPIQIAESETQLRRMQFDLARLSPYGAIGALPQLQSIQQALLKEIQVLEAMAKSQDLTHFEQIQVKKAILSREIEIKQNQKAFIDAIKDSAISQVLGSTGGGRSIIISQDRMAGIGLRKGLFDGWSPEIQRAIVGNVNPAITPGTPITPQQIYKKLMPKIGNRPGDTMKNIAKVMMQLGSQMNNEFENIHNELNEPDTNYAAGRLQSHQGLTP